MTTTTSSSSSRRDFLRNAAIFGGAVFFSRNLIACAIERAAGDDDAESSASDLVTCAPPVISANHGHALVVSQDDLAAGVAKTYSIKGASGHDHVVTITAAQFATLAGGGSITVVSSNASGHTHSVTVTCATTATPDGGSDSSVDGGAPGDAGDASSSVCANGARASSISANHGHTLTVPKADVVAGTPRTYSIKGTSTHPHDVTISASDFTKLKNGETITLASSNVGGHTHSVKVVCG